MKIGLVLEGGAHRTIFSCGVMDALLDANIKANYVIGSSAGVTYGVSYVSGQHGRNREMQRRFVRNPRYAGMLHRLNPFNRSYYNLKFVFSDIPNKLLPFDYKAYEESGTEVLAAVTNVETGEAEYLPVSGADQNWTVLQATCALPLMFKNIVIDGKRYADGGVADSIPFQKALDDGCDKLIVVLTRERSYMKTEESLMGAIAKSQQKKHPAYAEALRTRHERYNSCIDQLTQLEQNGRVYVIAPEDTLGVKRTDKRVEKLMALYGQGYSLTAQQMQALRTYLENDMTAQDDNIENQNPEDAEEMPKLTEEMTAAQQPEAASGSDEDEIAEQTETAQTLPTDENPDDARVEETITEETEQDNHGGTEI